MAKRFVMPIEHIISSDASSVGAGWKVNFYEPGTTTRKDTYTDDDLATPNANPVVADSAGRLGEVWLKAGQYKVVLTDADDVEIFTADPVDGDVGGENAATDEKTGAYTVTIDDNTALIPVDASGGAVTITLLPAATAGNGFKVTIKKTDSSANAITVDGDGAETIDGAATYTLDYQYQSVTIRSDGSNWHIEDFVRVVGADLEADAILATQVFGG